MAIAEEMNSLQTAKELTTLMRSGKMKEFYKKANELLKIRRAHPVVSKIMREDELGEVEVYEEKETGPPASTVYTRQNRVYTVLEGCSGTVYIHGSGEVEVYEEKETVERLIAQYFTDIYKRPPHMRIPAN